MAVMVTGLAPPPDKETLDPATKAELKAGVISVLATSL